MFENFDLRLPEIGKIKIGQKGEKTVSQYGKEFQKPEKLDYFKVVKTTRGDDGNYLPDKKAIELYGEKPTELNIRFISPRLEDSIQYGYALYDRKGNKLCFGDGKNGWNLKDPNTGEMEQRNCGMGCEYFVNNQCKKWVKLACIVEGVGGIGGVHTLTIKGRYTVPAFCGSIVLIKNFCDQHNGLINEQRIKLKLSEFSSKFGKVYSPFCELAPEDFKENHRKELGNSINFKLLADLEETAEETEAESSEEKAIAQQPQQEVKAIEAPKLQEQKPEEPQKNVSEQPKAEQKQEAPEAEAPKEGYYWCENKYCKDPVFKMEISDSNTTCVACDNKYNIHLASDGKKATAANERLAFLNSQNKKESSKQTVEKLKTSEATKTEAPKQDIAPQSNNSTEPAKEPNLVWHWCDCKDCVTKAVVIDTNRYINTSSCPSCHKSTLHVAKNNTETSALEERKAFIKRKEDLKKINTVFQKQFSLNNSDAVKEKLSRVLDRKIKSSNDIKDVEIKDILENIVNPFEDPGSEYGPNSVTTIEDRLLILEDVRQIIKIRRENYPEDYK